MEKIILYGAGKICDIFMPVMAKYYDIISIVDKRQDLWGENIYGIPIISLQEYVDKYSCYKLILTVSDKNVITVMSDLKSAGISDYSWYKECIDVEELDNRERLVSYSMPDQLEDVILYNVFSDFDKIFYIDIGSNDPLLDSVTKLLYDIKNASGINIEPQQKLIDLTNHERIRDINICIGLGDKEQDIEFFVQGGLSTVLEENIKEEQCKKIIIHLTTLEKICNQYIKEDQQITFLKIDVEGYERNVLLGADFKKYRPMVIVMEATLPQTDIQCHDNWEDILISNNYCHAFSYGVNRYYVAQEHNYLCKRFISILDIMKKYKVFHVNL